MSCCFPSSHLARCRARASHLWKGIITAYDAATGKQLWRFHTIPQPGEANFGTWAGDSWKTGGVATWNTGSYDPESNTVYWGTSNPWPDYNGDSRAGDNLYACSVLALDPGHEADQRSEHRGPVAATPSVRMT